MPPDSPKGICEICKGPCDRIYYCSACHSYAGTHGGWEACKKARFKPLPPEEIEEMRVKTSKKRARAGGKCPAIKDGFVCTLGASHAGPHEAHGSSGGATYLIWEDIILTELTKEVLKVTAPTMAKKELDFSDWARAKTALDLFDRVFMDGPPGVGKSSWAKQELKDAQIPFEEITLNADIMAQEILGYKTYGEGFKLEFEAGPVARAVKSLKTKGKAGLIINEISRASGAVLDFMLQVLDDSLDAAVTLPGGETYSLTGLKIIGTSNSSLADADPALSDRFPVKVHVDKPSPHFFAFLKQKHSKLAEAFERSYFDGARPLNSRQFAAAVRAIVDRKQDEKTVLSSLLGPKAAQELFMEMKLA